MSTQAVTHPDESSVRPVTRFVWSPVPVASLPEQPSPALSGKRIVTVGGNEDSAGRIASTLREHGAIAHWYRPEEPDLLDEAVAFTSRHGPIDGIIDLNLAPPFDPDNGAAWQIPLQQSVALLKACYVDWVEETDGRRLFYLVVTRMGGRMGFAGDECTQPLGGIWAGLAKTVPIEIPNCNVRILDLSPEDEEHIQHIIARELYRWGLFEIGYQHGRRYTLVAQRAEIDTQPGFIGSDDTILISGGSRGIGFALAWSLATVVGCRVIVTGRMLPPRGDEPWLVMDDETFQRYRKDLYRQAGSGGSLVDVRRSAERMARQRELVRHLQEARVAGLHLEYRVCDFTSKDEVRRLLSEVGSDLTGIIHNAGIDTPTRLPRKTLDSFVETIQVKVNGFLHILQALQQCAEGLSRVPGSGGPSRGELRSPVAPTGSMSMASAPGGRELKFFCNVGSLTGRMGGMVGQLDYSAANEGLSRLGLWLDQRVSFPVQTLCWPTWEKLGMITNYEATLKYMSAMRVEEGLALWQDELRAGSRGEVTFVGHAGSSLSPIQLRGYAPTPAMPEIGRLLSHDHYLGEVLEFRRFCFIRSRNRIASALAPCLSEFTIEGAPAIPISVLLEYALSVGAWVMPEGWPDLHLHEVRNVMIHLPSLRRASGQVELIKEGTGRWLGEEWNVDVQITGPAGTIAARLQLVYGREDPEPAPVPAREQLCWNPATVTPPAPLNWTGLIYRPARWQIDPAGNLTGRVRPCPASDLWSIPSPPHATLPACHLENIIQAAVVQQGAVGTLDGLLIPGIQLFSSTASSDATDITWGGYSWIVLDQQGHALLRIEGPTCLEAPHRGLPTERLVAHPTMDVKD